MRVPVISEVHFIFIISIIYSRIPGICQEIKPHQKSKLEIEALENYGKIYVADLIRLLFPTVQPPPLAPTNLFSVSVTLRGMRETTAFELSSKESFISKALLVKILATWCEGKGELIGDLRWAKFTSIFLKLPLYMNYWLVLFYACVCLLQIYSQSQKTEDNQDVPK